MTGSRVLIIGKDGRTDAIADACVRSGGDARLFAFAEMQIPGLFEKCERVYEGSLTDRHRLLDVVKEVNPDLVLIGPEEPLAAGYVDILAGCGIATFGPNQRQAQIESSKSWARELVERHEIPGNPQFRTFTDPAGLASYIASLGDVVVKPDGLTAGKGVRVMGDHLADAAEATRYARLILSDHGCVHIEERLVGEEFSLQTITDGRDVLHCPLVQDHKRAFEGDRGPNTGGMGSYSAQDGSLPFLEADDLSAARRINEQVIEALGRETGSPYRGVLYGGFMVTARGLRLIEYNARFGDPEAMNVLPLLDADFVELCSAVTEGQLGRINARFEPKATVCKYVVPNAYPGAPESLEPCEIRVKRELTETLSTRWFWAASRREADGRTFMSASRAGAAVGIGDSLPDAERAAEQVVASIEGPIRHREDVGTEALVRRRVEHMRALRSASPTGSR